MGMYAPGDYVKVEFRHEHSGESEWMWVKVEYSDDRQGLVFGTLDNEPIINTDLRLGLELAVSYEKVKEHMTAAASNQ